MMNNRDVVNERRMRAYHAALQVIAKKVGVSRKVEDLIKEFESDRELPGRTHKNQTRTTRVTL